MSMIISNGSPLRIPVLMVSSGDDKTAMTAQTSVSVLISKNGGGFFTVTNAATEVANGWYYASASIADFNTDGPILVVACGTSTDVFRDYHQVVTTLPANATQWAGTSTSTNSLALLSNAARVNVSGAPANWAALVISAGGVANANVTQWVGTSTSTNNVAILSSGTIAEAPVNFAALAIAANGKVTADVTSWAGTSTSINNIALLSNAAPLVVGTNNDKTGYALSLAGTSAVALTWLQYDMSGVSGENGRSPLNALRFLRNFWSTNLVASTLVVMKEDDATTAWTAALDTTNTAAQVVGIDPA